MKAKQFFLMAMCFVLAIPAMAQLNSNEWEVNTTPEDPSPYVEGEVIVKYKASSAVRVRANNARVSGVSAVDAVYSQLGVTEVEELMPLTGARVNTGTKQINGRRLAPDQNLSKLALLRFSANISAEEAAARLEQLPQVEYAEPNYKVYIQTIGGGSANIPCADSAVYCAEPLYSQQWGPAAINLPWLWNQPKKTTKRPVIAIIDTGVDINHPDLAANIWTNTYEMNGASGQDDDQNGYFDDIHGYDFVNNSYTMQDRNGHGTHCAGIAAAVGDNGIGITGANPDAYIMPIAVLDKNGTGDIATAIKGIDYAVANGADVLSMSFGSCGYSQAEKEALLKAYYADKVLVAAAGNNGTSIYNSACYSSPGLFFPAAYSFVIGVEALGEQGNRSSFTNYDPDGPIYSEYGLDEMYNYETAAPGVNIYSTFPNGSYKKLNGTSMACPYIAGAISRLLQCRAFTCQEMLLGAIITSQENNSAKCADLKSVYENDESSTKPVLAVMSYSILDTIIGCDADGRIDAGEIIEIYPTVKNIFGQADSIVISLSVADISDASLVQIQNDSILLGASLSSGAIYTSPTPFRVGISDLCGNGYPLKLYCSITSKNASNLCYGQIINLVVEKTDNIAGIFSNDTILPSRHYTLGNVYLKSGVTLTISAGSYVDAYNGSVSKETGSKLIVRGTYDSMATVIYPRNLMADTIIYSYVEEDIQGPSNRTHYFNCDLAESAYPGYWGYSTCERCNIRKASTDGIRKPNGYSLNNVKGFGNFQTTDLALTNNNNFIFTSSTRVYNTDRLDTLVLGANFYSSSKEDVIHKHFGDYHTGTGWGVIDFSHRLMTPCTLTHGVVWKVLINGVDIIDDYDQLSALGVGKHKCEVYFNCAMDTAFPPTITYGLRLPYSQNAIDKEASWSADSTVYSAYFNITGKEHSDGINRICISGAKDQEHFVIITDDGRFDLPISSVGSLSTGLMAEAGLGKVTLTWETDEEDFEDLLGYNIYRWTNDTIRWNRYYDSTLKQYVEAGYRFDTILVNPSLINSQDNEYIDFDVVPGKPYYYIIKQMTTSLENYNISNPVVATPLTAIKGDANGSMTVDVADVITEVNYISRQNPQPFIFEAADVNSDNNINIFDVIGTINLILHPEARTAALEDGTAYYYVENGILYVESDAVIAGVQFAFAADSASSVIRPLDALTGFEQVAQWMNEEEYFFMAYSMTGRTIGVGKTALLQIGDAEISSIALSDVQGHNIACTPMVSSRLDGTRYMPNVEKFIKNGHMYIRMGDKIYTATGQLVE